MDHFTMNSVMDSGKVLYYHVCTQQPVNMEIFPLLHKPTFSLFFLFIKIPGWFKHLTPINPSGKLDTAAEVVNRKCNDAIESVISFGLQLEPLVLLCIILHFDK